MRIISLLVIFSFCMSCAQRAEPKDEFSWIHGKWKDENSTIEYTKAGIWYGQWDNDTKLSGNWTISKDTLIMSVTGRNKNLYIIQTKSEELFTIKSVTDGAIFNKERVK